MARSSQGANFTLNRAASHAGSWYTSDGYTLNRQLDEWLKQAGGMNSASVPEQRAIVAPHAGYSYSGPTAAYAYRVIVPSNVKRVFILGPSHHYRLQGCALSRTKEYETPLYNLKLDTSLIEELHSTGNFEWMSQTTDEDEHSIEMHLPYIAKVMEGCSFTIVPVLVGNLNRKAEQFYGHLFSKYLADKENFFVISSDFCHWGKRFSYKHYDKRNGTISQHIENLDKAGMKHIEALDSEGFYQYLRESNNTICGRHPIAVLLNAVESLKALPGDHPSSYAFEFLHYAQSNQCASQNDSSVSYAAGSLTLE